MRESKYQADLRKRIENLLPGCLILKNDPTSLQGVPDLLILHNDRWAMLEVKVSEHAPTQPNQPYYVDRLASMSFASFIYPEIEEDVLNELQLAFRTRRKTRVSQPK